MCGGTGRSGLRHDAPGGLSPRVRGNRAPCARWPGHSGSIPACAGEPVICRRSRRGRWVYPRVCGGTVIVLSVWRQMAGLSPRVRGNRQRHDAPDVELRSIPACAGEPARRAGLVARTRVYPRVCGGTPVARLPPRPVAGLSPRVRGNHRLRLRPGYDGRSIPACAGEPAPASGSPPPSGVYPRVCGGTMKSGTGFATLNGLSPRVRGNRQVIELRGYPDRSIPACAGEPAAPRTSTCW